VQHVDEDRYGENRPAAAEEAEYEPDEEREYSANQCQ
jgi:hypothetical protein